MAILDILVYPNPALRQETVSVIAFDDKLRKLIADMWETLYAAKGVGLAAPQVGVPLRLLVVEWEDARKVLINPRIVEESGAERSEEGCLSFPGVYEEVERPERIRVVYWDENGESRDEVVEGYLARIFSHEMDHLNGKLIIDRLSLLKRTFLRKKFERKARAS
ncbi:MAG: peptide deformylase [Synergistaceae bacterium]|jgi:peptide deformylase|nr:peptide deformylase [Synergistaceae bacterium]